MCYRTNSNAYIEKRAHITTRDKWQSPVLRGREVDGHMSDVFWSLCWQTALTKYGRYAVGKLNSSWFPLAPPCVIYARSYFNLVLGSSESVPLLQNTINSHKCIHKIKDKNNFTVKAPAPSLGPFPLLMHSLLRYTPYLLPPALWDFCIILEGKGQLRAERQPMAHNTLVKY